MSDQRHRVSSEEAFIATVVKLATGLTNVSLRDLFGRNDDGLISRMTNHTINWLDEKCQPLLCDNSLARWVHLFPDFADAIAAKLNSPEYGNLVFRFFRIMGFLDCKIDETCTPGSGPVIDEPLSARHPEFPILQEAVFSGYLKRHGLKVLTVVFPNGIIGFLYGPISARENDIGLLNLSGLNQNLMALQPEVTLARLAGEHRMYYALFGDSIFPYLECICKRHLAPHGGELGAEEVAENHAMNSVRTSAEWPYETVTTLFHVMRSKHNKKMLTRQREPNTTLFAQLRVVFFLYNCYVCMNGSKFQKFFDMEPPTIEEYLTAE